MMQQLYQHAAYRVMRLLVLIEAVFTEQTQNHPQPQPAPTLPHTEVRRLNVNCPWIIPSMHKFIGLL